MNNRFFKTLAFSLLFLGTQTIDASDVVDIKNDFTITKNRPTYQEWKNSNGDFVTKEIYDFHKIITYTIRVNNTNSLMNKHLSQSFPTYSETDIEHKVHGSKDYWMHHYTSRNLMESLKVQHDFMKKNKHNIQMAFKTCDPTYPGIIEG